MSGYRAKPPKGAVLNRADPLASGLKRAWLMSERSGPTTYDSVGGTVGNGTLTNGPTWATGQYGPCLSVDGTGATASGILASVPATPTVYSFSIWVYATSSSGLRAAMIGGASASGNNAHLLNYRAGTSAFSIQFNGGAFPTQAGATVPAQNKWYHVVVTFAGASAGQTKIYLNGTDDTSGTTAVTAPTGGTVLTLGNTSAFSGHKGLLDAACYWNRVLSLAEVKALYADPFGPFRRRSVALLKTSGAAPSTDTPRPALVARMVESGAEPMFLE